MCRKSGLERKRHCGWLGLGEQPKTATVWARKRIALSVCPKSYITAESISLLDEFAVRRRLGRVDVTNLSGRQVDAFLILEEAVAEEIRDGQQNAKHNL